MEEYKFISLMDDIIQNGELREDRTGTGTKSVFGRQIKFDISEYCPVMTTKKIPWKHCIEELLWFLRGDTDVKKLSQKGVKIWNGNSSRDFLDNRNLQHLDEGDIGPGYGFQWRHSGANYQDCKSNYDGMGVDQIENIIKMLKDDPFSRRIILNAWNPSNIEQMALPPCHCFAQFFVSNDKELSCHMYQRSVDTFLGFPWNILSYSILTKILAMKTGLKAKELTISTGDTHIYSNHIDKALLQISRTPSPNFPKLVLCDSIKEKSFEEITICDFELVGYNPQEAILASMAV